MCVPAAIRHAAHACGRSRVTTRQRATQNSACFAVHNVSPDGQRAQVRARRLERRRAATVGNHHRARARRHRRRHTRQPPARPPQTKRRTASSLGRKRHQRYASVIAIDFIAAGSYVHGPPTAAHVPEPRRPHAGADPDAQRRKHVPVHAKRRASTREAALLALIVEAFPAMDRREAERELRVRRHEARGELRPDERRRERRLEGLTERAAKNRDGALRVQPRRLQPEDRSSRTGSPASRRATTAPSPRRRRPRHKTPRSRRGDGIRLRRRREHLGSGRRRRHRNEQRRHRRRHPHSGLSSGHGSLLDAPEQQCACRREKACTCGHSRASRRGTATSTSGRVRAPSCRP